MYAERVWENYQKKYVSQANRLSEYKYNEWGGVRVSFDDYHVAFHPGHYDRWIRKLEY